MTHPDSMPNLKGSGAGWRGQSVDWARNFEVLHLWPSAALFAQAFLAFLTKNYKPPKTCANAIPNVTCALSASSVDPEKKSPKQTKKNCTSTSCCDTSGSRSQRPLVQGSTSCLATVMAGDQLRPHAAKCRTVTDDRKWPWRSLTH